VGSTASRICHRATVTWAMGYIVIIAAVSLTIHALVLLYYREVITSCT